MAPSSLRKNMKGKEKEGILQKSRAIMKKQSKSAKTSRRVLLGEEDLEEVGAWSVVESRKILSLSLGNSDVAETSKGNDEITACTQGKNGAAFINPPNEVVSEWVYEQGVICTICLQEMGTVSTLIAHLENEHKIFVQSNPTITDIEDGDEGMKDVATEMEKTTELLKHYEVDSTILGSILPRHNNTIENKSTLCSLEQGGNEGSTLYPTPFFENGVSACPSAEKFKVFSTEAMTKQYPNTKRNAGELSEGIVTTIKEKLKKFYRDSEQRWGCPEPGCKANFWKWDNCLQHLNLCHPDSKVLMDQQNLQPESDEIQGKSQTDDFCLTSLLELLKNPIRVEIPLKKSSFECEISVSTVTKSLGCLKSSTNSPEEDKTLQPQQDNIICPLSKCGEIFPSISSVNLHLKLHHKTGISLNETNMFVGALTEDNAASPSETEICAVAICSTAANSKEEQETSPSNIETNKELAPLPLVNSGYPCTKCGHNFKRKKHLCRHLIRNVNCDFKKKSRSELPTFAECRKENGKFYECPSCWYKAPIKHRFVRHILLAHSTTELATRIESAKIKSYQMYEQRKRRCITCKKVFKNPLNLQQHVREVHKIKTTLKTILEDTRYAVKEDARFIQNMEKEDGKSAVNANENPEPGNAAPNLSAEVEAADIPSDSYSLLQQNENDDVLPAIALDKENLSFFDAVDDFEVGIESVSINVFEKNGESLPETLSKVNTILSNEEFETFPVEECKNANIPSSKKEEEAESRGGEKDDKLEADDNHCSADESDVELPPPGFEEEEELPSANTQPLLKKKPFKRIGNKGTVTDYSFLQPFKRGRRKEFQCPLCPNLLIGCFSFCRHLLLCHPTTDLTNQVSAKKIKGLIGMERVKYKCHICDSVMDSAFYLSRHFKRVHKYNISVEEVIDKPSLLVAEVAEGYEAHNEHSNLQEDGKKPLLQEETLAPESFCSHRLRKRSASISYRECSPIDEKDEAGKRRRIKENADSHLNSLKNANDSKCQFFGKNFFKQNQGKTKKEKHEKKNEKICEKVLGPEKNLSTHIGWHKRRGEIIGCSDKQPESQNDCGIGNSCPICEEIIPLLKTKLSLHIGWHKRRGEVSEDGDQQDEQEHQNDESENGNFCPICKEILPPEKNLNLHIFWHKRNKDGCKNSAEDGNA